METKTKMQNEAARVYLQNRILNANSNELQLLLYDGAIRFTKAAKQSLENKDFEGAFNSFEKVNAILLELLSGLRPELQPDLCAKYASLYHFCLKTLLKANVTHSTKLIEDALPILEHLRDTWIIALDQIQNNERANATEEIDAESESVLHFC